VNEHTEEFDEQIKNRHMNREGITHFEAPIDKRLRELEEERIRLLNGTLFIFDIFHLGFNFCSFFILAFVINLIYFKKKNC